VSVGLTELTKGAAAPALTALEREQ
jgi:hypothetical protein